MDKKKLWTRTSLGLAGAAMALAVGVSLGNGAETMETKAAETPIYTLSPVKDGHNAYATAAEVAVDGVTWSAQGNLSIAPSWRIGGKSLTAVDRTIFSKTPLNHEMKKVDVHLGAMSSITLNSFTLEVASDAGFNTKIDTVTAGFPRRKFDRDLRPDFRNGGRAVPTINSFST